jgi:integrase
VTLTKSTQHGSTAGPRSLPIGEWPPADRKAWEEACRPGSRFKLGGAASRLAEVSRADFAQRYGAFLGFLERSRRLDKDAPAAMQVTLANVEAYIADLTVRVRSVTLYNCVSKLRRAAKLLRSDADLSWLAEIEKDIALTMEPRSKFDRLVFADQLVEAGLSLMTEAQPFAGCPLTRARGIRNGLMIALLGVCPVRLKNFAELEIGTTFKNINGQWWIALPKSATKTRRRPEERPIPPWLNPFIEQYLTQSRPTLLRSKAETNVLWISSTTGRPLTKKNLGTLISRLTLETLGVDVSPHLFRTAAASTAAAHAGATPHLASALLNHTDPRITEEHYIRASSVNASRAYEEIIESYLRD